MNITIREASAADIPEIIRQRRCMYEDMHYEDTAELDAMAALSAEFLGRAIPEGTFHAWLAEIDNLPVGGGAVIVSPWPAHPYDLDCRRATILNVYTDRKHRRRGIARQVMLRMMEWCKQQNFARVTLHASEDGRQLYESLGFAASNEMRLNFRS